MTHVFTDHLFQIPRSEMDLQELAHYPPMFNMYAQRDNEITDCSRAPKLQVRGIYRECSFEIVLPGKY